MSNVVNWVKRHRRKFLFGGALVGGIYIVGKVAQWQLMRSQDQEAKIVLEKVRKQNHFSATESTCSLTLEALFPSLRRVVECQLDADRITTILKNKPSPSEKLQLWEELKVIGFSRCFVLIVGGVYLAVMIRVQLNILAGYLYVQEIAGQPQALNNNREVKPKISVMMQEKFLNICTNFVSEGIEKLCVVVSECVEKVVNKMDLKQNMNLVDIDTAFNQIFNQCIHESGEKNIFTNPGTYFLSDDNFLTDICADDQVILKQMLADALDVIENDDTQALIKQVCRQGLSYFVDIIAEHYANVESTNQGYSEGMTEAYRNLDKNQLHNTAFVSPVDIGLPLAKLIPVLSRLVSSSGTDADHWLVHLQDNPGAKLLGANVYETFCQQQKEQPSEEGWGDYLLQSASSWF